jgi:hypothetical protein
VAAVLPHTLLDRYPGNPSAKVRFKFAGLPVHSLSGFPCQIEPSICKDNVGCCIKKGGFLIWEIEMTDAEPRVFLISHHGSHFRFGLTILQGGKAVRGPFLSGRE